MTTQPTSLKDVINDCGGAPAVAKRLRRSNQYVHEWLQRGHLPLSELTGRTRYSETLASMQREGKLSAAEIRRIGLRL
ncbi:hypothetical protein RSO41_12385 [Halomonas sp. I1]|uniref:hypothetical protein n=1 Tax=Halomonas sp. I1 TaxID=393536 RepID=UPI0028DE1F87|nr:hypothetical protein [Halomonas sp. I1]MDT8895454.1 hypothetical protein [Halomonas sp. I1]